MRKLLLLVGVVLLAGSAYATTNAFTPFYLVSAGGNNLNSGSTTDAVANTTYTSKVTANGWDGVSVFTVASGNPTTDTGVTNGAFVSIYVTSGAVTSTYVARITNTSTTTFTTDRAAFSGAAPASDGTGATTAKVGGAWIGPQRPQTNNIFPWGFVSGSMTNSAGEVPMVNISGTWWVTNTLLEPQNNGTVWFRGYTNNPGDGGFANIYGSNGIAGYNLMQLTGANRCYANMQFATNGNSGGAATQHAVYVLAPATENLFYRCIFHDAYMAGLHHGTLGVTHTCEAWNCNLVNSAGVAGIQSSTAGNLVINCFSHGNPTANGTGFRVDGAQSIYGCVSATNGGDGFYLTGDVQLMMFNCSIWGNKGNGLNLAGASGVIGDPMNLAIINCSWVSNTLAAITNTTGNGYYAGVFLNNGFGSGSQANGQGDIMAKFKGVIISNSVSFASGQTPWNAPSTYDFSITSTTAGAKAAGYGKYYGTYPGYGGTVAYPDIGAAQATSTNGAAIVTTGYGQ
jgi:hypothetical protein